MFNYKYDIKKPKNKQCSITTSGVVMEIHKQSHLRQLQYVCMYLCTQNKNINA